MFRAAVTKARDGHRIVKYCQAVAAATAVATALAGCASGGGGGGGGSGGPGVGAIPPTPSPPPTSSAVDIFDAPASQEFAAVGPGGPSDQLRIRYDAATKEYQVLAPGRGWDVLIDDPLSSPQPGSPNQNFRFAASGGGNGSYFMTRAHHRQPNPEVQYSYSNLALWGLLASPSGPEVNGITAFGMATPAGGVPISGSGNFRGLVEGTASVVSHWEDIPFPAGIGGTVDLRFDFQGGSLAGEMRPYLDGDNGRISLGTLSFVDTVYAVGSRTYSGRFNTTVSGPNAFSGQFTGPNAQELIGRWAFPFVYPVDGSIQSASGAWIAKRE